MIFSGVQQFTLLDYKDTPACILFTPGCNFRCGFCHNPEFVLPEQICKIKDSFISQEAVIEFLKKREGMLDGVVITGGEPTIQPDLISFLKLLRTMPFKIKLDTNGSLPQIVEKIIKEGLVDYIAMDLKTSPDKYNKIVGRSIPVESIVTAVDLIKNSGLQHEFRTTMIKGLHSRDELEQMAIIVEHADLFTIQTFRPEHTLDPAYANMQPFTKQEMEQLAQEFFAPHVKRVRIL